MSSDSGTNQRQGAQSGQNQQPQGGQQPQGRAQQGRATQISGGNEVLVNWTKFTALLFGISGAGLGLFFILADAVDEPLLDFSGGQGGFGAFGELYLYVPFFVVILVAPLVGATLAPRIQLPQQEIFKVSFASVAAGMVAVGILAPFLMSTTFDNASIAFGGLLINTILAALTAGALAAGGSWAVLTQLPKS